MNSIKQPEYSKLAEVYDDLMEEVDYELWANFIDDIMQIHHPDPQTILELACGTGSLSFSLDELLCYEIIATDRSPDMIRKAHQKAIRYNANVQFQVMNFLNISLEKKFDVVLLLFDSINYLQEPEDILRLLDEVKKVLHPQGLFVFDFTTPRNSIQAIKYLHNEEGYSQNNYRFFRKSWYDAKERIHYNEFDIEELGSDYESVLKRYSETHRQRIYTLKEMLDIIGKTNYNILAMYDGFELVDASESSLRITMVLTCP